MQLRTDRLVLRLWSDDDLEPFAALNRDPGVMEHFAEPLDRAGSDRFAASIRQSFDERQLGLWAVEIPDGAPFIGFVGLWPPAFEAHFTPAVEIGWRLAREHWGKGYATEAARAALADGFTRLGLDEIVSFTIPANERSIAVMRRLGMTRDPADDFQHPKYPPEHGHSRHVLYRLSKVRWASGR